MPLICFLLKLVGGRLASRVSGLVSEQSPVLPLGGTQGRSSSQALSSLWPATDSTQAHPSGSALKGLAGVGQAGSPRAQHSTQPREWPARHEERRNREKPQHPRLRQAGSRTIPNSFLLQTFPKKCDLRETWTCTQTHACPSGASLSPTLGTARLLGSLSAARELPLTPS